MDNTSHLCARASLEIDIIVTQAKFTVHILLQFSTVGQFFRLTLWLWLIFPEYLRLADNESVECFTLPLTILSKANKNLNDIGPRLRFTSFLACALTSILALNWKNSFNLMSLIKKKRGKINVHFGWLGLNHKRKNLSFTSTFGVDPSDWVGGAWVMNRPIFFFYMQINEHRWLDVKIFFEITKKFNGTHLSGWPSAFFGPALPLPSFSRNRDAPFRLFSMANVNWR